jgi:3-hydroxyisobutyrate dehydrogenase-like beta-hydroxyacid dehydrogenase
MEKIGFIGLGAMGKPMANNLIKKGFSLVVFDLFSERMEPLKALGAEGTNSCKEVAERMASSRASGKDRLSSI